MKTPIDTSILTLPNELTSWIGNAPVYENSGASGAQTLLIDKQGGAYLKIGPRGALASAAQMQSYFSRKGLSSEVLYYLSLDRDYLMTAALRGEDGVTDKYLSQPERLSEIFGESLRLLHETDASDCPVRNRMDGWLACAQSVAFRQSHLDDISGYIGPARAENAAAEIAAHAHIIQNDVLIHGDYCLPNIILNHWKLAGFIDVADSGIGDRHYDLALGLWTLNWNLKDPRYGGRFLDAYGRERIDMDRLRVCGLLAATE